MIARVSRDDIPALMARHQPAIVQDALAAWRPAELWSPQHLLDTVGHCPVRVSVADDGRFDYEATRDPIMRQELASKEMAFADAARTIMNGTGDGLLYVMQQSIPRVLPDLMANVVVPEWVNAANVDINLWFGQRTVTPLHFDYANNFFAQLHGIKQFTIFAPQDTDLLYPYPQEMRIAHASHVDPDCVDSSLYPKYRAAVPIRFELNAGELLFLPAFWWHQVRSTHLSVSVSFWWPPQVAQFIDSPNSTRALYRMYAADRLAHFKQVWLEPNKLTFAAAATLLLRQRRNWAAGTLALAAFDEAACCALGVHGVRKSRGCALSDLWREFEPLCKQIASRRALSAVHRSVLERTPSLAASAACCDDDRIDPQEVADLLRLVTVLQLVRPAA